jgi:hypothetical protein
MRALILIAATLAITGANALTIKSQEQTQGRAGSPSKVKLVITPGENINLGKLDLLIVVDDSGSMDSHQRVLSSNVPSLAAKLANFSSLNVAVISSDMTNSARKGQFIFAPGTPAVLTNTMPNFKELLAKRMMVGTNGSATEMFFSPVMAATSKPLIDGVNKNFLREDAHLGVVIVTDTDDQSPNISPEQFIMHLASMKQNNYSLINFIDDPNDKKCSGQNHGKVAERLALARYMANGSEYNICGGKFAEGISDVANKVERELNSKIALPMKPDVATITVAYGTLVFPPNDAVNGWTYDEPTNTIHLGTSIDFNKLPPADLVITFNVK